MQLSMSNRKSDSSRRYVQIGTNPPRRNLDPRIDGLKVRADDLVAECLLQPINKRLAAHDFRWLLSADESGAMHGSHVRKRHLRPIELSLARSAVKAGL